MFTRLCYVATLTLAIALNGCGNSKFEITSVKMSTQNDTTDANVDDQESTQNQDHAQHEKPEQQTASTDVREAGPSDGPNDSSKQTAETPEVKSTLKDIPPPTEEEPKEVYVEKQTIEIPKNWTRVTEVGKTEVWVDLKAKQVMVAGRICVQQGGLEMFVCPFFTKEHESVVAVNARSYEIHTSLLAIGVKPGKPVQWHPAYKPATGPTIDIDVMWKDEKGKIVTRRAQEMVTNFKTDKPMKEKWVFGGSEMHTDKETGETFYYGDGGELVCLSNFSTATMDLPVESPDANDDLLYCANPEMIPAPGTKVYVVFKPEIKAPEKKTDPQATQSKD